MLILLFVVLALRGRRQDATGLAASTSHITMSPAGLCFADVTFFFLMSPFSFDNGRTDPNADCCVNTIDEKILRLQI